jgi:hypothetical protein
MYVTAINCTEGVLEEWPKLRAAMYSRRDWPKVVCCREANMHCIEWRGGESDEHSFKTSATQRQSEVRIKDGTYFDMVLFDL